MKLSKSSKPSGISLIVTTYNWPKALDRVLHSISKQSVDHDQLEVIIADDGSRAETKQLIEYWQTVLPFSMMHVWQEDKGFRAAKIRNIAAQWARKDYIVYIDGDCILHPRFIHNHLRLAEQNWFVAGNRILLSPTFTETVIGGEPIVEYRFRDWFRCWREKKINRILPHMTLPFYGWRKISAKRWQGVKTCNLGVWRKDFYAVNGLDECYEGWGFEDSDLAVRLINRGIGKKIGRFAVPVYHLYHSEADRAQMDSNFAQLQHTIASGKTWAEKGLQQYQS